MKRFVICFDGTWQQLRQPRPTNIAILARSIAHTAHGPNGEPIPQIVIYSKGVGANTDALGQEGFIGAFQNWLNRMLGGIFGEGLEDELVETYLRLAFNYEADDEIYVFGFSRGAFMARSFTGLINAAGIISRVHAEQAWEAFRLYRTPPPPDAPDEVRRAHLEEERRFRLQYGKGRRAADGSRIKTDEVPNINYLGIFDTVGQRGMPTALGAISRMFNKRYGFHSLNICPNVLSARHAVAIDERRLGFPPTLWDGVAEANAAARKRAGADPNGHYYAQRWFIGTHGDVGGGEGSTLSAAPLKWIAEGARNAGLRFYAKHGDDESPLDVYLRECGLSFDGKISRPKFWDSLSPMNYPLSARRIWRDRVKPTREDLQQLVDEGALKRAADAHIKPRYRPASLKPFRPALRDLDKHA
ncbi:MAG TPA: DUF2235 domain-containing protein [Caulobacterales bacterium]|nr:DUF2235 domain-containing protein [Caulobacterales bacterium]